MQENRLSQGIFFAIVAAIISGVSIFINKFAVDNFSSPLFFTTSKNVVVGLMMFAYIITSRMTSRKISKAQKINTKDVKKLLIIGVIGGALPFYLFFTGLSQISAINAAIIQKTLIIWVALLAVPFLKEKVTIRQGLIITILFYSNTLIGGFNNFTFSWGEIMILAATLLWSIETIIVKKTLQHINPNIVATARMGLGAIFLLIATYFTYPQALFSIITLNATQLFWLILTSIMLFGYVMTWYKALAYAPAITVTSILVGSTLITNVLSALFITHNWNMLLTFQSILLSFGITLLILEVLNYRILKSNFFVQ